MNNLSGILLVDKPEGITSAQALNQIKRAHKIEKIGHGGTLDPFATGLLVVFLGEATKIARFLLEGEKEYIATAQIGTLTDTGDHTGIVIEQSKEIPSLSISEWQNKADQFLGKSSQIPPNYSAVKINGKALYEYARKGEEVIAKPREIHIPFFKILTASPNEIIFQVKCSGGTYIRTLAIDLAKSAGTLAHLVQLRRTQSSMFHVNNAQPLQTILNEKTDNLTLFPVMRALDHLPKVLCNAEQTKKIQQGNLSVFSQLKNQIIHPGFFILIDEKEEKNFPIAIANHHPMMVPSCSIERVFFDPSPLVNVK